MALNWLLNLANKMLLDHFSSEATKQGGCGGLVETTKEGGCGGPAEATKEGGCSGPADDYRNDEDRSVFRMPLHYPRYRKSDYEKMEEWKLDMLLEQYGLEFRGSLDEKRRFAMGHFLWPDQL